MRGGGWKAHTEPPLRGNPEPRGRRGGCRGRCGKVLLFRNQVWGQGQTKKKKTISQVPAGFRGEGGQLGGRCLPQGRPRGSGRGAMVGLGARTADAGGSCRAGSGPCGAAGGGARAPRRGNAAPGGAALRLAYARPPGPAPTHLRALNRRNRRKCRRPAPLRRPHYFRDAL